MSGAAARMRLLRQRQKVSAVRKSDPPLEERRVMTVTRCPRAAIRLGTSARAIRVFALVLSPLWRAHLAF
jgi:hypothetical protein